MQIVKQFPPIYNDIAAAFDLRGCKPIFAWGDIIYNPHNVDIPPELIVHEAVHMQRQGVDPEGWWRTYISSPQFRLDEELLAHRAEYQYIIERSNRNRRRMALKVTAQRLASRIYGSLISVRDAKLAIAGHETCAP